MSSRSRVYLVSFPIDGGGRIGFYVPGNTRRAAAARARTKLRDLGQVATDAPSFEFARGIEAR